MKHIEIPETYKNVLERNDFECSRAVSNAAFLLSGHLEDKDASYLDSDEWKHMEEKIDDVFCERELTYQAIIYMLNGEDDFPDRYHMDIKHENLYITEEDNPDALASGQRK